MIDIKKFNEYRQGNLKQLKDNGIADSTGITKLYKDEVKTSSEEYRAWEALEKEMQPLGFSEFVIEGGHIMSRYGTAESAILCRCFLQHYEDRREYTICALINGSVLECASFKVIAGKKKFVVERVTFDVAALVLPH